MWKGHDLLRSELIDFEVHNIGQVSLRLAKANARGRSYLKSFTIKVV